MTNYIMGSTYLLRKFVNQLNQYQAKLWWAKFLDNSCRWISWEQICKPLNCGGLGARNMHFMNLALLTKLAFRVLPNPNSLISRVLMAKYEKNRGWFSPQPNPNHNPISKGIHYLRGNTIWACGNGRSIRIGLDPWVSSAPSATPRLNPRYQLLADQPVASFIYKHKPGWNVCKVKQFVSSLDVAAILADHPSSPNGLPDTLLWTPSTTGRFSVKLAFRIIESTSHATHRSHPSLSDAWKWWWKLPCHPRLMLVGWSFPQHSSHCRQSHPSEYPLYWPVPFLLRTRNLPAHPPPLPSD